MPATAPAPDPWEDQPVPFALTVVGDQVAAATTVTCRTCGGVGEVYTGHDEPDTGAPITRYCAWCRGEGCVPVDLDIEWCEDCGDELTEENTAVTCAAHPLCTGCDETNTCRQCAYARAEALS